MKKTLIFLVGVIFISSCLRNGQSSQEEKWLENYNRALLTFHPSQTNHFPNSLDKFSYRKLHVYYEGATNYNNKAGLILNSYSDSSYYNELKRNLILNNFPKYDISSENIVFIGDTVNDYSNVTAGIAVPSFKGVGNKYGICNTKLNERGEVYIIESKSGEFLDSLNLVRNLKLPTSWEHGYSRGIVLDSVEFNIVYWLVIW